jgi:BolA family transcriptional regulator, general stress-responsive regulator
MSLQQAIENKIASQLKPSHFEILNESHMHSSGLGAESHFKVLVVSDQFFGMNRVQRQQKVYGLLSQELQSGVHALSLRLLTQSEWKQGGAQGFQSPACQSHKKS